MIIKLLLLAVFSISYRSALVQAQEIQPLDLSGSGAMRGSGFVAAQVPTDIMEDLLDQAPNTNRAAARLRMEAGFTHYILLGPETQWPVVLSDESDFQIVGDWNRMWQWQSGEQTQELQLIQIQPQVAGQWFKSTDDDTWLEIPEQTSEIIWGAITRQLGFSALLTDLEFVTVASSEQLERVFSGVDWQDLPLIEIRPSVMKERLESSDYKAWHAIQQGKLTEIDLEELLVGGITDQDLPTRLDAFAIYDSQDRFLGIIFQVGSIGQSGLEKDLKRLENLRFKAVLILVNFRGEIISTLQHVVKVAANSICSLDRRPDEVHFGVDVNSVTLGASAVAVYKVEELCQNVD